MLWHWYSHGSSALFSSRQSRVVLQLRPLFCILPSWAASTLVVSALSPVLPSFLLAKGIALSERKVIRTEWNLPENALLFRVYRMGVGVAQKLNATVGSAERKDQNSRQRRERCGSLEKGWGVMRQARGFVNAFRGRRELLFSGNSA